MKVNARQLLRKGLALILSGTLALSTGAFSASAISGDENTLIYEGNLLLNPGFESLRADWDFINSSGATGVGGSGSGVQQNNPHTGKYGFFLDRATRYGIEQTVIVPYSGYYKTSAYIATGGSNSTFGVKYKSGEKIEEITLPNGATYSAPHTLPSIELKQGDEIQVYVYGGSSWTNGDDFTFEYDASQVTYNLMKSVDFAESATQNIRVPRAGDYVFSADVSATTDVTISSGTQSQTVSAGSSEKVTFTVSDCTLGQLISFVATGEGTISNPSLVFDVSSVPNEVPSATEVKATGTAHSGLSLTGTYAFNDPDEGQTEGNSSYRWLMSDTQDGEYTAIENETSTLLTLTDALEGKYIKFEVTPVDNYGLAGEAVLSDATGPVQINWIRNPGLEIESSTQGVVGWSTKNGGSTPNNKNNARGGFRYVSIPAGDSDAEAYYGVEIERSAYYIAGAWVKLPNGESTLGVRLSGSATPIKSVTIPASAEYAYVTLSDIALEKGSRVEVYVMGNSGSEVMFADDFELIADNTKAPPAYTNLISFTAEGQVGSADIDTENKTITFKVPYGTDASQIKVEAVYSDGATMTPASGSVIDFSDGPVKFTIQNGEAVSEWTVTCIVNEKKVMLESDNKTLEDGFNWAVDKTAQFVMTGQHGIINGKAEDPDGTGTADYIPSYWAGYYNRTAFYGRDFVHQATGAELVGLTEENYSMFNAFAKSSTEARKWYALWALNFDGSPYTVDYRNDTRFVREVPAQFELVEKAYKQFLWSGDERYISDEMFNFYTKVMTDFVTLHDTNGNGVAEGTGGGIWEGSCTYNERGGQPIIEAGDAIGSQYQATLAYAGFCKARGDEEAANEWYQKAADLKKYFNEEWGVMPGDEDGNYARALSTDGVTKYNDFGKENSWFMPLKMITEPGEKNDNYLDFISKNLANGIGTGSNAPSNIEAYTYIPDMFFLYNRNDDAWKWMKYILSIKDEPHENAAQGTNGDYPEISYTLVSQTVEGMMGVTPNAQEKTLTTVPRLPSEVGYATLKYQEVGNNEIDLTHEGNTKSTLHNTSGDTISWESQFYGTYNTILFDGKPVKAQQKEINGETISYAVIPVKVGDTVTAEAADMVTVEDVAAAITEIEAPVFGNEALTLPEVPEGFTISIQSSSNEDIIALDGSLSFPTYDTEVTLVLTVANGDDTANTADITVTVPGVGMWRTLLKMTIDTAEAIKAEGLDENLVSAIQEKFEAALENAWVVYKEVNSTDEQLAAADEALINIMHYLNFTANPTGLKAAIERAEDIIDSGKYLDDENMQAYKDALQAAKDVLDNELSLDADYDEAIAALQEAEENLVEKPVVELDLDELKYCVELAEVMNAKLDKYYDGTEKDAFVEAFANAKDILEKAQAGDDAITQARVDEAAKNLHSAMHDLRLIPNKDALKELLEQASSKNLASYTAASANVLLMAMQEAKAVYNDPQASVEEVEAAVELLDSALKNLVPIDQSGTIEEPGDTDSEQPDDGTQTPDDNTDTTPTGDNGMCAVVALMVLSSAAAWASLKKRKAN